MAGNLGMAYNVQRKAKKMNRGGQVGCRDCMAMGGKCMAHGGAVENEKLHPGRREAMPEGMREDLDAMDESDNQSDIAKLNRGGRVMQGRMDMHPMGNVQSNRAKFSRGGSVADDIMQERRARMADGGLLDADAEDDFDTRIDFEPVHTREDERHDTESGSLDDESLVGQILKDRKNKKRGE